MASFRIDALLSTGNEYPTGNRNYSFERIPELENKQVEERTPSGEIYGVL